VSRIAIVMKACVFLCRVAFPGSYATRGSNHMCTHTPQLASSSREWRGVGRKGLRRIADAEAELPAERRENYLIVFANVIAAFI
jgi:hypothetical protein